MREECVWNVFGMCWAKNLNFARRAEYFRSDFGMVSERFATSYAARENLSFSSDFNARAMATRFSSTETRTEGAF